MKMVNISAIKAFLFGTACGAAAWAMWQDIHKAFLDERIVKKAERVPGA